MTTTRQPAADVLVVGDGIIGLAAARELSRRGLGVEVLGARPAAASRAAAGMLAPLNESQAGSAFQRVCLDALERWPAWALRLAADAGVDLPLDDRPTVLAAFTAAEEAGLERLRSVALRVGAGAELVPPEELLRLVPWLAPGAIRGLVLPDERRVDPRRVVAALERDLDRRGVVRSVEPVEAVEPGPDAVVLRTRSGRRSAPTTVLAAGTWTSTIRGLGLDGVVQPVRGQMIAYRDAGPDVGCLRHDTHYALCRDGELWFGATEEDAGFDDVTTDAGRRGLREAAERLFPALRGHEPTRSWSGLRPGSADGLPLVGPLPGSGIVVATGTYRNGILLAPWIASAVADGIVGGALEVPPDIRADRFVGGPR